MIKKYRVSDILSIFFGGLILCYYSFYNGFPLVYADTGVYILSGFLKNFLSDRPIFYGLFIFISSLSVSLPLTVFVQGIIVSWLIHLIARSFLPVGNYTIWALGSILSLTFTTGVSYNVSLLMPDIFAAVGLMCIILLLFAELIKLERIMLLLLLTFSIICHNSHSFIYGMLLSMLFVFCLLQRRKGINSLNFKKLGFTFFWVIGSMLIIPTTHFAFDRQFIFSDSRFMFQITRLNESQVLHKYLSKHCDEKPNSLCWYYYNDPGKFWNFLWGKESPANQGGGWQAHKKEYEEIISDIYSDSECALMFFRKSIEYTAEQFFLFDTGDTPRYEYGSAPFENLDKYFNFDMNKYIAGKQHLGLLRFTIINWVQTILVFFSYLVLFYLLFYSKRYQYSDKFKMAGLTLLFGLIANATVCATLATVVSRYQSRVIWLLPLFIILFFARIVEERVKPFLKSKGFPER